MNAGARAERDAARIARTGNHRAAARAFDAAADAYTAGGDFDAAARVRSTADAHRAAGSAPDRGGDEAPAAGPPAAESAPESAAAPEVRPPDSDGAAKSRRDWRNAAGFMAAVVAGIYQCESSAPLAAARTAAAERAVRLELGFEYALIEYAATAGAAALEVVLIPSAIAGGAAMLAVEIGFSVAAARRERGAR